jgi:hypothetical protein
LLLPSSTERPSSFDHLNQGDHFSNPISKLLPGKALRVNGSFVVGSFGDVPNPFERRFGTMSKEPRVRFTFIVNFVADPAKLPVRRCDQGPVNIG